MSAERHRRVKELFLELSELDPDARAERLAGLDPGVRGRVQALLDLHDREPDATASTPMAFFGLDAAKAHAEPEIAGYRIVRLIGEGGMGRVYEARQLHPVRRSVAVKVVEGGSRDVLARFESERQTLALMHHPNVARILDAGTTASGAPFFAMELVRGETITAYCRRRQLDVEERLRLFVAVCHGVQHAHQRGILHRDLKPSNILVSEIDDRPVPVIIDFGIAKAMAPELADTGVETVVGQLVGTPAYMSPEQLSLGGRDLDTRTDVYALGVLLYELLTGEVPFELAEDRDIATLRERICHEAPVRPSTRVSGESPTGETGDADPPRPASRRLRGDLDWITLRALAKERSERYASVSELAADVERHLDGQPVLAGPPSTVYRLRKLVARHKVGVAAVVGVTLALILGLVGTSVGMLRARRAEAEVRQQARTAEEVAGFLIDLFQVSDPYRRSGEVLDTREILERGAASIEERLGDEPAIRAALMRTMGQVYRNLGLPEEAEPLLEGAVELLERELGPDHPRVAATRIPLGWLYYSQGRHERAEQSLERAVTVLSGSDQRDEADYAWALQMLGILRRDRGEHAAARDLLERSLAIRERALGPDHVNTAWSRYHLAWLENLEANYEVARDHYEEVLGVFERELGPSNPAFAWCLNDLGVVLHNLGESRRAGEMLERAIAIQEQALGPDHPDLAAPLQNLAIAQAAAGDLDGAITTTRRTVELRERSQGPEHPELAASLGNLGFFLLQARRLDEAEDALERALSMTRATLGESHPEFANELSNLGTVHRLRGDVERARSEIERAAALQEEALGPDHPLLAAILSNLAGLHVETGSLEEAARSYERALEIRQRALGHEHLDVGRTVCRLAEVYRLEGDLERAGELYARGAEIGFGHPTSTADALALATTCLLGDAVRHAMAGDLELAEARHARARELMTRQPGLVESSVRYQEVRYQEARYQAQRGDRDRALGLLREAIEAGYRSSRLIDDPDLEPLRGDPELERLARLADPRSGGTD